MYYTCGKDGNVLMDSNGKPKMGRRGVFYLDETIVNI